MKEVFKLVKNNETNSITHIACNYPDSLTALPKKTDTN